MAYTTIDKPSDYFETTTYSGNNSNQSITSLDFAPNWVWFKGRSGTNSEQDHQLFDTVRGVEKRLASNTNGAESTDDVGLTAFNSNGWTMGSASQINGASTTYVGWSWKKTADAGFDIVSYSGNNSTNRQISHSLSAKPDMMLVKCRQAGLWKIYHSSLGATKYLVLSDTAGVVDNNSTWNDTEPTSSNFTLGDDGNVNETGETYINYLFAEKQGYSKFGSYEGNGNADGTFVYLGFKPAFLIVKPIDATDNWVMFDNKRLGFNSSTSPFNFYANKNFAETTDTGQLDFVSNGFKIRNGGGTVNKTSTYIYMAFAEQPFVTSTGVPATAK